MEDNKAKVIFQPSGRRGEVPKDVTLIEASRLLGVDIESLCGEKKTQERMWHTLQTGKPLRN